jgi:cytochrome c oxidase subunit 4
MAEHIVSRTVYLTIFIVLMVLTGLTVFVATIDLGPFNAIVALSIAVFKATLVVLYFMHVRYSSRLTWVFVTAGFFWMGILVVLTLSDYFSRSWTPIVSGQ